MLRVLPSFQNYRIFKNNFKNNFKNKIDYFQSMIRRRKGIGYFLENGNLESMRNREGLATKLFIPIKLQFYKILKKKNQP